MTAMLHLFLSTMKPTPQAPLPGIMKEEWDNPAMTEFKRQEAEERVAFAQSHTQEEWRAALRHSTMRDEPIRLAPKRPHLFPFKPIKLPW
jgi:hypothetical protein